MKSLVFELVYRLYVKAHTHTHTQAGGIRATIARRICDKRKFKRTFNSNEQKEDE